MFMALNSQRDPHAEARAAARISKHVASSFETGADAPSSGRGSVPGNVALGVQDKSSRPFAGITRIRFEGSPHRSFARVAKNNGLSAPAWGSPRNVLNVDPCAPHDKGLKRP